MPKKSAAERLKQRAQMTPRLASSTIQQMQQQVKKVTQLRMEDAQEFRRRENDRLGNLTTLRKEIGAKQLALFGSDLSDQGKLLQILVQTLIAQNFSDSDLKTLIEMALDTKSGTQTASSALIEHLLKHLDEHLREEIWQEIEADVHSLPTYGEAVTLKDVARIDDENWQKVQTFLKPKPYKPAPSADLKKSMVTQEIQPFAFERRFNFPTYLIASQPSKRLVASILRGDGKTNDLYAQVEANTLTPAFVIVRGDSQLEEVSSKDHQPGRKSIISADDMVFEVLEDKHQTEVDKRQLQIEAQQELKRREMFTSNSYHSFREMIDDAPNELSIWLANNQLFVDVLKLLDSTFESPVVRVETLKQLVETEEAKYNQQLEEIRKREEKAREDIDVMRTGFAASKAMSTAALNDMYTRRIAKMEETYRKEREMLASKHKAAMDRLSDVPEPEAIDAAHFVTELDMQLPSLSEEVIAKKCSIFCRPLTEDEWKLLSSDNSDLTARNALLAELMSAQDIHNVKDVFAYVRDCIRNHCGQDIPIDVCLLRIIKQFRQTLPMYSTMQFSFPGYMRNMSLFDRFGPVDAVIEWKTQEATYRSSQILLRRVAEKNVLDPTSFVSSVQFTLIKNRPIEEVQNVETNLNTLMSSVAQDERERIIRCILESPNPLSLVKKVLALEYCVDRNSLSTADFCSSVASLYKALGLSENGDFKTYVEGIIRPTMMMEDTTTLLKIKYMIDHNKYFQVTEDGQKVMDTSVDYLRDNPRGDYSPEEEQKIRDMESEFARWMKLNYLLHPLHRSPRDEWIREKYAASGEIIPPSFDQIFQVWMTMRYLDTHRDALSRCFKDVPADVFDKASDMNTVHTLFLNKLEKIDLRTDCPDFVAQHDMRQLWEEYYASADDDEKPEYDESLSVMANDFTSRRFGDDHFIVSVWKRCHLYPTYLTTLLNSVCPDVEASVELFTQQEMQLFAQSIIIGEMDADAQQELFNAWTKYRPYHFSRYLYQHLPHLFGNPTRMFIKRLTGQKGIPFIPGSVWRALSTCNQRFTRYEEFADCVSTSPGMRKQIEDAFKMMDVYPELRNKLVEHLTTMIRRSISFLPTSVFESIQERVGNECKYATTYEQFLNCLEKVDPNLPQVLKSLLLDAEMVYELDRLTQSSIAPTQVTAPSKTHIISLLRKLTGLSGPLNIPERVWNLLGDYRYFTTSAELQQYLDDHPGLEDEIVGLIAEFEDVITEQFGEVKPNDPELLEVYGIESSTGLTRLREDWKDNRKSLLDIVRQSLRVRNGDMVIESLGKGGKGAKSVKGGKGAKSGKSGKSGKPELTIVVDEEDDLEIDPALARRARDWAVRQKFISEQEIDDIMGDDVLLPPSSPADEDYRQVDEDVPNASFGKKKKISKKKRSKFSTPVRKLIDKIERI